MVPLAGIRVLDLTRLLPGPFATLCLVDLGAEVIRVESPGDEDLVRAIPPAHAATDGGPAVGALFAALNRGKRSIVLDLKSAGGAETLLRLAERADVVVEGFRPGVLDRLGIGWERLHARNRRLSLCSLSGYGQSGPLRDRAGHDLNYEALAGVLGIGGPADGPPAHAGIPIADLAASLTAVGSILAALLARERAELASPGSGRGTCLDVSMYDAALSLMTLHLAGQLAGETMRRGAAALSGKDPNYRAYRTRDGRWLAVANLEPKFWRRFVEAVGREDLAHEALRAMGDPEARRRLHDELERLIASRTLAEWRERLDGADACVEPVLEGEEVLAHPHAQARGAVLRIDDPRLGTIDVPRTAFRPWSAAVAGGPVARTGEDGEAVLREAGFSADEIGRLRRERVLG